MNRWVQESDTYFRSLPMPCFALEAEVADKKVAGSKQIQISVEAVDYLLELVSKKITEATGHEIKASVSNEFSLQNPYRELLELHVKVGE